MKLYHSSTIIVEEPDTNHSRDYLDFGKGFYLTSMYEQAVNYAQRFKRRRRSAWLNIYEFEANYDDWNVLQFNTYNKEWLNFVSNCRSGKAIGDYDMIVGGIANDKVIETLDLYFARRISQEEALGRLIYEKPNIQYCIRSQKMLNECLTFIESKQL